MAIGTRGPIGWQAFTRGKGVNALFTVQTNEQPYIRPTESELEVAQLWRSSGRSSEGGGGCFSTAETGWSESIGQFGDANPHLFVYSVDCGGDGLYSSNEYGGIGLGAEQRRDLPELRRSRTTTSFHVYGARMDGNNWWIYYDGQWVGYIPALALDVHVPERDHGIAGRW